MYTHAKVPKPTLSGNNTYMSFADRKIDCCKKNSRNDLTSESQFPVSQVSEKLLLYSLTIQGIMT